jgi:cysteine desulfurase
MDPIKQGARGSRIPSSVYLDYCATTPVDPEVRTAMAAALENDFGNPSSMHWAGQNALALLDKARAEVAERIGCTSDEIVFTSGATEADNLALLGVMHQYKPGEGHLVTTAIEHHAVLHAAQWLEREGYAVTYLPVDGAGLVDPRQFDKAIRDDTVLVSVMLVNNEVGTIEPISEIAQVVHNHGVLMHTDAVQGVGLLNVAVDDLHVDLLSLSGHKIYGPKGVGALFIRRGVNLDPMLFGGSQEHSLRPGTENVPGIVGLGAAIRLTGRHKAGENERLGCLRRYLVQMLKDCVPQTIINGPESEIAPHIVSTSFPGSDAEMILLRLNQQGIAVSLGSACNARSIEPSHVLSAMGISREQIEGSLRISMGYPTTRDDIDILLGFIPNIVRASQLQA